MGPKVLDRLLSALPRYGDPNVLIGFDGNDDAGVYRLTDDLAIVQTIDFFTPIVDDPFTFGAIAAANALSDVYAMGGRPISALSVLACPASGEVLNDVAQILRGGAEKMHEAGASVIGGHSVIDEEIKFGYAVTGVIHPDRIQANGGAREGDLLYFTKRLGTGVIATALKRGIARDADVQASIASMLQLNRAACEAMLQFDVHGCTDVSGFGLLGHARERAIASKVTLEIDVAALTFLPGALEYARQGAVPGGLKNNREYLAPSVEYSGDLAPEIDALLYDPQTSGGLLITIGAADGAAFAAAYPQAVQIGKVNADGKARPLYLRCP